MTDVLKRVVSQFWPIIVSYVPVGLACGVLEAQAGMAPWMAFIMGAGYLSGSGQFMMSNLWIAGTPIPSIAVSVATISSRFALYSASLAPHLKDASRTEQLAVTATLTEEAFGVSVEKLACDPAWKPAHAFCLNFVLLITWATSCAGGCMLGSAVDIPTAVAGFACTSLFIFLLFSQEKNRANIAAALVAACVVFLLKSMGASGVAMPVGALVGVFAALIVAAIMREGGDSRER